MARGTQLGQLIDMLRAELRQAQDAAVGLNFRATHVQTLNRVQDRLWESYDWPHLKVTRDKDLQAGQRLYDLPADIPFERILRVQVKVAGQWYPSGAGQSLEYGIAGDEYSILDSEAGVRQDPVQKWDVRDGNQFEVWPVPTINASSTEGVMRFTGIRKIARMQKDSDVCELDDNMLVLYAAAELLTATEKKDAQAKLEQANEIFFRLRAGGSNKRPMTIMGGGLQPHRPRTIIISPVWRPSGS